MAALEAKSTYEHPLTGRYASKEMSYIWSPAKKFSTWRQLWLALAESEKELGLEITEEQLTEMRAHLHDIDYELAAAKEKEFRHDVMAHVHTFGTACPSAMPIIHLGATSCYVGDNTDLIQMKEALQLIRDKLVKLLDVLKIFAQKYADMPTLGFTHCQPAQLTTVGKRCSLWMQDFVIDFEEVDRLINDLPMRGVKGTTGTQATFLELFEGDHTKVVKLNELVCEKMGFCKWQSVSGQTYTRKYDFMVLSSLSGLAQSAYKMCGDIRLLASMKEIEEPFEKSQIGSSAMAYKRNPMRSERVCSLSRYLIGLPQNAAHTHANQWFERTLDDSAIRRIVLPEGFLAADVVLTTLLNIADGLHVRRLNVDLVQLSLHMYSSVATDYVASLHSKLIVLYTFQEVVSILTTRFPRSIHLITQVWPAVIRSRIDLELPFMATEVILMQCVKAGGDRQELHEAIREHSMEAGRRVKEEGAANDLLERIAGDAKFAPVHGTLHELLDPTKFVGRAPEQVHEFIAERINPILQAFSSSLAKPLVDGVNV